MSAKKLIFTCAQPDNQGNPIPASGCGEVDYIWVHCYNFLDRVGEDIFVGFKNDKTFTFEFNDSLCIPTHWDLKKVIVMANAWSRNGKSINVGSCPKCGHDVYVEDLP